MITSILAAVLVGTALQLLQAQLQPLWAYLALGVFALVLLGLSRLLATRMNAKRPGIRALVRGGWILAVMLSSFALCGWRAHLQLAQILDPALEGQDIQVQGWVADMPQQRAFGVRLAFEPDPELPFSLSNSPSASSPSSSHLPKRVQLTWYHAKLENLDLEAGQYRCLVVRLKRPHGYRNPWGFDDELKWWEQGVGATGYVRPETQTACAQKTPQMSWKHPIERGRQAMKTRIWDRAQQADAQSPRSAAVIGGLLIGDQSGIDGSDWDLFRQTGITHLMSISGLHITVFAYLASFLMGCLWRWFLALAPRLMAHYPRPRVQAWAGLCLATAYAVLSGWGVPAQRTVAMLLALTLLKQAGLRWPLHVVALWAAAAVVLWSPYSLLQSGFWLSFTAVMLLWWASQEKPTHGKEPLGLFARVWQSTKTLLHQQAIVSLGLMPWTVLLFHQVSVLGLLVNLVAIPWVTLLITPLCLLGVLFPLAWDGARMQIDALMHLLNWSQSQANHLWGGVWWIPVSPWWAMTLAMLGAGVAVTPWPARWRILGTLCVIPALCWPPERPQEGRFDVRVFDIGQGNSVLVRTAHHSLLYDTGPKYSSDSDAAERLLMPFLRATGEHLDRLVISHADSDHSGGAASIGRAWPSIPVMTSMKPEDLPWGYGSYTRCENGQMWVWDGVRFEILSPWAQDYAYTNKTNPLSCVLQISQTQAPNQGTGRVLLTGDMEVAQERALLERGWQGPIDGLLVPHHGSQTSSSESFLKEAQPRWAWVQAGYRNPYHHPHPSVQARYEALHIPFVRSDRCGAMVWRSTQAGELTCERDIHPRYWDRHRP